MTARVPHPLLFALRGQICGYQEYLFDWLTSQINVLALQLERGCLRLASSEGGGGSVNANKIL